MVLQVRGQVFIIEETECLISPGDGATCIATLIRDASQIVGIPNLANVWAHLELWMSVWGLSGIRDSVSLPSERRFTDRVGRVTRIFQDDIDLGAFLLSR